MTMIPGSPLQAHRVFSEREVSLADEPKVISQLFSQFHGANAKPQ